MRIERARPGRVIKQKSASRRRPKSKAAERSGAAAGGRRAGPSPAARGMRQLAAALKVTGATSLSPGAQGMRQLAAALEKLA